MQFTIVTLALSLSAIAHAAVLPRAQNFQTFTGALGGITAIPVSPSGNSQRPFAVDGTTDVNIGAALQRSCSVQHNQCADAANSGAAFSVSDCQTQQDQCNAAASGATNAGAASGATAAAPATTGSAAANSGSACSA